MRTKIDRDEPCPCGSGKQYKKCCNTPRIFSQPADIIDFAWRKLLQLEKVVFTQHLIPYVTQALPQDMMICAIYDCFPDDFLDTVESEWLFGNFFLAWLLFNWIPQDDFGVEGFEPKQIIGLNYRYLHEDKLNTEEKRFIDRMSETYYSFYRIHEVDNEKALVVHDLLLGTTHTIKEREGTRYLKRGDVVYSRLLTLDNQSIFVGMAPVVLPAHYHHSILDFKGWLMEKNGGQPLAADVLRNDFTVYVLDYFVALMEATYGHPFSTRGNTDDELS